MSQPAYVIGHIRIKNAEKWDEYRSRVPATLAPFDAELLLRAQLAEVFGGRHDKTDTVVIRFPDLARARAWHTSPDYQALIALRNTAAEVDLLCFEG